MGKRAALLLIAVLTVSCLIVVNAAPASASILNPSVPEFTLKFVAHPYDVAPTTTIDPYTGENVTVRTGYRVQNRSIEVIIKNQPFTPYRDSNGNYIDLYYNVSSKGHYESNWQYYPTWLRQLPIKALDNDYTILSFGLDVYKEDQYSLWLGDISAGAQVDFQVQAMIGYYTDPLYRTTLEYNAFTGETSGWSNTQTITIPTSTPLPENSSSPTSTPDQTTESTTNETSQTLQFEVIMGTVIAVVVVGAGLLVYFRKRRLKSSK